MARIQNLDYVKQILASLVVVARALSPAVAGGMALDVTALSRAGILREIHDRLFKEAVLEDPPDKTADEAFQWL